MKDFCKKNGFMTFLYTSAKTGKNINELFSTLVFEALKVKGESIELNKFEPSVWEKTGTYWLKSGTSSSVLASFNGS